MRRLIKINTILVAIFAVFFAVSCDNSTGPFDDNGNGLFDSWDTNSDGIITQAEFNAQLQDAAFFDEWDTDGNGVISETEWNNGVDTYFTSYDQDDYSSFNAWDENGDGVIKEDEFDNGIFDFVDHDSNDKIDENEFINWFGWWPGNG